MLFGFNDEWDIFQFVAGFCLVQTKIENKNEDATFSLKSIFFLFVLT